MHHKKARILKFNHGKGPFSLKVYSERRGLGVCRLIHEATGNNIGSYQVVHLHSGRRVFSFPTRQEALAAATLLAPKTDWKQPVNKLPKTKKWKKEIAAAKIKATNNSKKAHVPTDTKKEETT